MDLGENHPCSRCGHARIEHVNHECSHLAKTTADKNCSCPGFTEARPRTDDNPGPDAT